MDTAGGSGKARSKLEFFEDIRSQRRREGLSIRALAEHNHVHRRTVREALASPAPPPRKEYPQRARPVLEPWLAFIDEWPIADLQAPRKQRHTAVRVWRRLVSEYGAQVFQRTVSGYVAKRKRELGIDRQAVYVPQAHDDCAEGEVDFGDFHAEFGGVLTKLSLFELRLSASAKSLSPPRPHPCREHATAAVLSTKSPAITNIQARPAMASWTWSKISRFSTGSGRCSGIPSAPCAIVRPRLSLPVRSAAPSRLTTLQPDKAGELSSCRSEWGRHLAFMVAFPLRILRRSAGVAIYHAFVSSTNVMESTAMRTKLSWLIQKHGGVGKATGLAERSTKKTYALAAEPAGF